MIISFVIRFLPWVLGMAMGIFALYILIVLLGGLRIEVDGLMLSVGGILVEKGILKFHYSTIEFPVFGFFVSLFSFLGVIGKWKESITLCMSILIAAMLGEVLLRALDHPLAKPYLRQLTVPSSSLGHILAPNFQGIGPGEVPIKVNSQGFRDAEHVWKKDAKKIRILGLGDSFTMGWGVPREKTFLQNLRANLERKTGKQFEAVNAGVPGWGLNNYYFYLKHIGQKYSPDVVVIAYYIDDIAGRFIVDVPGFSGDPFPTISKDYNLDFEVGGLHHFRIFNFSRSVAKKINYRSRSKRVDLLSNVKNRRILLSKRVDLLLSSFSENSQYENKKVELENHLARIKQIAVDMGASLILMLIPDVAQLHHIEVQNINTLLKEYARRNDVFFLDMTNRFEESSDLAKYYLIPKDYHTNILGHAFMGDALGPLVCQALMHKIAEC